ncbi:hypothetical protein GCM10022252_75680 [Streptosporangium oxazolinicum]|uniref:Uncharacterized protein n=1 Tax=Streptosporangium oxazolinicum TaxID=909287 RepID=A0ABP8BM06_9ACTN
MPVVEPEDVADLAGIPLPLDQPARTVLERAIAKALAAVTAYLGRPAVPATFTQSGARSLDGVWQLDYGPVISITSATPETDPLSGQETGAYTVVYTAGKDPAADPVYAAALAEYVTAHAAAASPTVRLADEAGVARRAKSLSVSGDTQSITYADEPASSADGAAGAPPTLTTLKRWKRRGVHQQPGIAPHPLQVRRVDTWW